MATSPSDTNSVMSAKLAAGEPEAKGDETPVMVSDNETETTGSESNDEEAGTSITPPSSPPRRRKSMSHMRYQMESLQLTVPEEGLF